MPFAKTSGDSEPEPGHPAGDGPARSGWDTRWVQGIRPAIEASEGAPRDEKSASHAALDEGPDRAHVAVSRPAPVDTRRGHGVVPDRRHARRPGSMPEALRT